MSRPNITRTYHNIISTENELVLVTFMDSKEASNVCIKHDLAIQ